MISVPPLRVGILEVRNAADLIAHDGHARRIKRVDFLKQAIRREIGQQIDQARGIPATRSCSARGSRCRASVPECAAAPAAGDRPRAQTCRRSCLRSISSGGVTRPSARMRKQALTSSCSRPTRQQVFEGIIERHGVGQRVVPDDRLAVLVRPIDARAPGAERATGAGGGVDAAPRRGGSGFEAKRRSDGVQRAHT